MRCRLRSRGQKHFAHRIISEGAVEMQMSVMVAPQFQRQTVNALVKGSKREGVALQSTHKCTISMFSDGDNATVPRSEKLIPAVRQYIECFYESRRG